MNALNDVLERVRGKGLRVALPESGDPRIVAGARRLADEALARPVLVGHAQEIAEVAAGEGIVLDGIEIAKPDDAERLTAYSRLIAARREKMTETMAMRLAKKPVYFAAAMLAGGEVDAMVAGVSMPTRRVIEAGMMTVGLDDSVTTPSSYFLMAMPGGATYVFADCALNIEPTAEDLWLRYRASAAHGLALWLVTAASDWQRPEVSRALAERYAAAFVELDAAGAIGELAAGRG